MPMIHIKPENPDETCYIFRGSLLLVQNTAQTLLPLNKTALQCIEEKFAADWFTESNRAYSAIKLENDAPTPTGHTWIHLRDIYAQYDCSGSSAAPLGARAFSLLNWRKHNRFCGCCGALMKDDENETARVCTGCECVIFPRISPAIIVLVERGEKLLLARHTKRNTDVYTCLAGFVESGETLEECVSREVREECGIEIGNIRYAASQSWPYPDQLMLAFHAEYKSGDITLQAEEIDDADWFDRDRLPTVPRPGSIAHKLIMGLL